jgi:phosphoribosyl-ATP pyrophosphohydrolase/phosphoribosyl-AMP cyclohydrolase
VENIKFDKDGLIPAVAQDSKTGKILMLAYMNKDSIEKTLNEGIAWYYSRSRNSLWKKGETSGNFQKVKEIYIDCDMDALIMKVEVEGAACHTGEESCFYRSLQKNGEFKEARDKRYDSILTNLYEVICDRKSNPVANSYTNYLFEKGLDKILKKVGEEATEVVIGAKNSKEELKYEIGDLLYHLTVLMVERDIKLEDLRDELEKRRYK